MSYYPTDVVTLTAEFLTSIGGPLVDATDLTITISDPDGNIELPTTSSGIVHVSTGLYRYAWTIPANAPAGDHVVLWSGDGGTVTATDLVTVLSAAATWCTIDDVLLLTGKTVSDAQLQQAATVLELHLGRTYQELVANPDGGTLKVGRRDREWLRRACAYQAAWMLAQPDMYQRLDMDPVAKSGVRGFVLKGDALLLAPLARRALQRVSWLRSRSLHIRTPFQDGIGPLSPNAVAEANDAYEPWAAMSFSGGDD